MKSKLFSVLMLIVAVLFVGTMQPVEASPDTDQNISIEQVVSLDNQSIDIEQETLFKAGPEFTAMEVCATAQSFEGDIDHQLIVIRAGENTTAGFAGYVPYMPRSNLNYLSYLA